MTRALTWTETLHYDEPVDPTYLTSRELVAYDGPHKIATVFISYGDENSANTTRGTIDGATVKGKFKKLWFKEGYTWRGDYVPALSLADIDVPKRWVEDRWAVWLKKQADLLDNSSVAV